MAVNVYQDLVELPARYAALFQRAQEESFFFSLAWYQNFVSTINAPGRSLRIYAAESLEAEPLGVLLMEQERGRRFVSRELKGLQNYYTSLFGPILNERHPATALQALTETVSREGWDCIDLHPLEADLSSALVDAFKAAGMFAYRYFCFGNWYLKVNDRSYQEYFSSLPSVLKNTIIRKRKQSSARVRVEIITDRAGLQSGIEAYHTIYNVSWKLAEPYPHFITGLMETCAEMGWLRLGILRVDNEPAAAQLWIVNAGLASIYKLAYDERFAKLSVGSLLTAHLMQHALDVDRVREVDYLSGDDAYKKDWMSDRRERFGVVALNPRTVKGLVLIAQRLAARAFKSAFRSARFRRHSVPLPKVQDANPGA